MSASLKSILFEKKNDKKEFIKLGAVSWDRSSHLSLSANSYENSDMTPTLSSHFIWELQDNRVVKNL